MTIRRGVLVRSEILHDGWRRWRWRLWLSPVDDPDDEWCHAAGVVHGTRATTVKVAEAAGRGADAALRWLDERA